MHNHGSRKRIKHVKKTLKRRIAYRLIVLKTTVTTLNHVQNIEVPRRSGLGYMTIASLYQESLCAKI